MKQQALQRAGVLYPKPWIIGWNEWDGECQIEANRRVGGKEWERKRWRAPTWAALLLLLGCATSKPLPPEIRIVPHVCAPTSDSPAFQKCKADCAGDAFIVENSTDTSCYCRKTPEST